MATQPCYPNKAPRIDEVLDVLRHHLRREILDYFENHADGDTASLDEVVAYIDRRVPQETDESIQLQLLHTHLPKLAATGWLDYDARSGTIQYHGHDRAEKWLQDIHDVFTA